jgi:NAD(P)-dependent dehydrogenase (short-subunit alcohol dehydrogenase family)
MSSDDRVAVVTGGARGIGSAACHAFHEDGLRVALVDLDEDAAAAAATDIAGGSERVQAFVADVSNSEAVNTMIDAVVQTFGRIDVVVNNAGIIRPGASQDLSDTDWTDLIDVHLGGTFRCSRAAFPHLRESQGSIVSIASVAARVGFSKRASYCAAKGGILALTRCLAVEWAPYGVRVNAVAPGHTRTQLVEHAIAHGVLPEDRLAARIGRIPMGRMATPAEIAAGIVFLGSPKASYISGETLYIDGAFSVNADELPAIAE